MSHIKLGGCSSGTLESRENQQGELFHIRGPRNRGRMAFRVALLPSSEIVNYEGKVRCDCGRFHRRDEECSCQK